MDRTDFHVVVPYYNEAAGIGATLRALAGQSDPEFTLVLVDNGSTDGGPEVVARLARHHAGLSVVMIEEPCKGTGAASDTGFRHAIALGARHVARTDADCLPRRDWIANLKRAFRDHDLELVIGRIQPRTDDYPYTLRDRLVLPAMLFVAENFGKLHRRGPQFKYGYIMVAGNNMAITADMYERAGGFPRTAIEHAHEDRVLADSVRTLTTRTRKCRDVVVYNSTRRVRRYGYVRTLLWYWDHRFQPDVVDVR
jgi:glycosyltransferase involved in cell wall biosynthesis